MEEVFRKADILENFTNLQFADNVALFNPHPPPPPPSPKEKHFNSLNSKNLKVGLKLHKGKTKYMTKIAKSEDILADQEKIRKRQN